MPELVSVVQQQKKQTPYVEFIFRNTNIYWLHLDEKFTITHVWSWNQVISLA